jgi:very-short-patch-repair endonuclease
LFIDAAGTTLCRVAQDIALDLKRQPFFVAEARGLGLSWRDLQAKSWMRLSRGQYAWRGLTQNVELALRAAVERLPPTYAFSGLTAAWLLGLDLPPCEPIEVTVCRDVPVRGRAGIRLRRASLREAEVVIRRGFRTTSALRTACDLGSRRDSTESVVALDLALHARLIKLPDLIQHVDGNRGAKGIKRLRRAVSLAEPKSESPMETRLRLQLLKARLPRPEVQVDLHDSAKRFLGRADLYYRDCSLVIEYDGESHRDRIAPDLRRQNALFNAGYHLLRFTAGDLRTTGTVAAQVQKARARLRRLRR